MKHSVILTLMAALLFCSFTSNSHVWVEVEQFTNHGGWTLTSQYMDQMGSPYLQAHGIGKPVEDASTQVTLPKTGTYYVYARTFNWTSPWTEQEGPGRFEVLVNGKALEHNVGHYGKQWELQYVGHVDVKQKTIEVALHDLTGFDGRCDALYFTRDPHADVSDSEILRSKLKKVEQIDRGSYELIVVGGGLAGMCAAVSAARFGVKTALIQDRSVLGGNNSSEIRVHTGGVACKEPYPNLGLLIREFGHTKIANGENDGRLYCDSLKKAFVEAEENITVFYNEYVNAVKMDGQKIVSIQSENTYTGVLSTYSAPLYVDCTGDGNLGYLAGADYRVGRESKAETGERSAVDVADKQVMGASVLWNTIEGESDFPEFEYGLAFSDESVQPLTHGEWTWETGMNRDQIGEAEYIRDYGMLVAYSNWSYLKNKYRDKARFANRTLNWVSSVAGKRESRRLLGDYILNQTDLLKDTLMADATVTISWPIDLHYPDPRNSRFFPGQEFISICKQERVPFFAMPYRCFYSRNIDNLFMAGRDISVTHAALGTIRVMRTTAMMGEVVGMAASVCKKHHCLPRSIYTNYFAELQELMRQGAGKKGLPDNQNFELGR